MNSFGCTSAAPAEPPVMRSPYRPSREGLDGRARTDQVAVAIGTVDAAHRRPHLRPERRPERIDGLLPGVRMVPLGDQQAFRGVRCAPKWVVVRRPRPGADL